MPKTILVVDDETVILELVSHVLPKYGFRVLVASSGHMALEICATESGPIDLLLTDIDMPFMDGRTLARCLASHRPEVPVLFMTGARIETNLRHDLTTAPELDGHEVIWKPFKPRELIEAIERLTSN